MSASLDWYCPIATSRSICRVFREDGEKLTEYTVKQLRTGMYSFPPKRSCLLCPLYSSMVSFRFPLSFCHDDVHC